jgi:FMN phosphatase YigB (HAD superfamily)
LAVEVHVRAVLFDLDGTLLDIDIGVFLPLYFGALGPVVAELTGLSPAESVDAVLAATGAMMEPHPARTNQQAFNERFLRITGVDLRQDGERIDDFYKRVFPTLRGSLGPTPGARGAVEAALACGFAIAVATNPIFPRAAIEQRISWAGLQDVPFELVTTYEEMHACKPDPAYFREIASILGVGPEECLMVGDDPTLDLGASAVGMRTFFVSGADRARADWVGTLEELSALLPRLAGAGSAQSATGETPQD